MPGDQGEEGVCERDDRWGAWQVRHGNRVGWWLWNLVEARSQAEAWWPAMAGIFDVPERDPDSEDTRPLGLLEEKEDPGGPSSIVTHQGYSCYRRWTIYFTGRVLVPRVWLEERGSSVP